MQWYQKKKALIMIKIRFTFAHVQDALDTVWVGAELGV